MNIAHPHPLSDFFSSTVTSEPADKKTEEKPAASRPRGKLGGGKVRSQPSPLEAVKCGSFERLSPFPPLFFSTSSSFALWKTGRTPGRRVWRLRARQKMGRRILDFQAKRRAGVLCSGFVSFVEPGSRARFLLFGRGWLVVVEVIVTVPMLLTCGLFRRHRDP